MKKSLISVFLIILTTFCFAVPGIKDSFATSSGEYVYYRDYTFPTETYIGFLEYSDGTIAIRYYAKNPKTGLNDISLYISLNSESDFIDMTGEKIIGNVTMEDTETLNYMHDLLYEFAGRRKKLNNEDFSSTVKINQDYVQFGGDVTMLYDGYIPLFQLNKILDKDGNVAFEAVTFGKLKDSSDTSFSDFLGFANLPKSNVKDKKIDLSDKWITVTDEIRFLGEKAFWNYSALTGITVSSMEKMINKEESCDSWFYYYATLCLRDQLQERIYVPSIQVYEKNNKCSVVYLTYSEEENIYTQNALSFDIEDNTIKSRNIFAIFADYYYENKSYFDSLVQ